eukprot:776449-Lingulodinium_polyedra.AAC.1
MHRGVRLRREALAALALVGSATVFALGPLVGSSCSSHGLRGQPLLEALEPAGQQAARPASLHGLAGLGEPAEGCGVEAAAGPAQPLDLAVLQ